MTKSLEAHIAELQGVIDGPGGKRWLYGPAVSALIAALEQSQANRDSWKQIAQKNISERETDIDELVKARNRITELESSALCVKSTDAMREVAPLCVKLPDENLTEMLRLVQCMLDDYRESNFGDAQRWTRHISDVSAKFEDEHGLFPYEAVRAAGGTVEGSE